MWNNRIIKHEKDGVTWYSVHEAFYNEGGDICGYTEEAITILGETVEEVKSQLEMITRDIEKYEVIDASTVKFKDWYDDYDGSTITKDIAQLETELDKKLVCDRIEMPSKEQVEQKTLGKLSSGIYDGGHY